ncbi:diguanylate cyclase [Acinetobacter radioresistens]|uniref:GGDEF domain-containing protein n=1 Tax=Acinetobacter radioresistens TaxID=40216 RepID=UPI00202FBCDD|nr:sensor domain-containing diguanylate cyclase [Acinetobacter radioresistens]MCM1934420.1 diguanylate cyclase [Acinetobacter radioresistens]MCM1952293.1 diguanylate cyclase [Acinetobacter radioresistens]
MPYFQGRILKVQAWQYFFIFAIMIFACCMWGIATRPFNHLAAFWPANSILLGCLARFPATRNAYTLAGAFTGYVVSDLLSFHSWSIALGFTTANLLYVIIAFAFYIKFRPYFRLLHQGYFYLFLLLFCCIGSLVSSLFIASLFPQLDTKLIHGSFWTIFGYWFSAELQNAILILPLILNLPYQKGIHQIFRPADGPYSFLHILPIFVLLFSLSLSYYDSGPGAILYPIAALIWCALNYRHFTVALITSISCFYIAFFMSDKYLTLYPEQYYQEMISLRFGIITMAIAPLTVSSINRIRSQLIRELQHHVAHDELTASLTRRQFMRSAHLLLRQRTQESQSLAVLMLDIDHFKLINDKYGHQAGDEALRTCAAVIRRSLRSYDLFGRLGGEEFAIVLLDVGPAEAFEIAERIRETLKTHIIQLDTETQFSIRISIGLTLFNPAVPHNIEALLHKADLALYEAKRSGRDRVVITQ